MGILNITPDSFSDGGLFDTPEKALAQARKLLEGGADILDVGGASTRPGAPDISREEELRRVIPVIRLLRQELPDSILSVDTWRAEVARAAVAAGADMVNDISGGDFDPAMFGTIAELQVPYILMHMQGHPSTMQDEPRYDNVVTEVGRHLSLRIDRLRAMGVNDLIIDPGFGFGKSLGHNYTLLRKLPHFTATGLPVMVGISRKSMIGKVLGTGPSGTANGTTVLHTLALLGGASLLRVHDPRPAKEAIKLLESYFGDDGSDICFNFPPG